HITPGDIPESVTWLRLYKMEQPLIPGLLPSSLTELSFTEFNQPLTHGCLPTSLTSLALGTYFNQPISPGILPSSLKSLWFGRHFVQSLTTRCIPDSVTNLTLHNRDKATIEIGTIPHSVRSLRITSLLTFKGLIPLGVNALWLGQSLSKKPQSLVIGSGCLPNSITSLTLGPNFNQPLEKGVIPDSVRHLSFGDDYNQLLPTGVIPQFVEHITFGYLFNQSLVGTLQSLACLITLTFGDMFNQTFDQHILPSSLQSLVLGLEYCQSLSDLPLTLSRLSLCSNKDVNSTYQSLSSELLNQRPYIEFKGTLFPQVLMDGYLVDSIIEHRINCDLSLPDHIQSIRFIDDNGTIFSMTNKCKGGFITGSRLKQLLCQYELS
ncbi:hypothetical protein SAMD00019534_065540, partial [Acytostelium subglobosum LB1]|uniref:hypothetical protein n=1 Tax=Acytostelium subglobosum LB1 TaxID=1410327 RepID=UPI000644D246